MGPHDRTIAADFLARCFGPCETVALLLRSSSASETLQRIVPLERALVPRYLGWLAHQNAAGFSIYVAANPLRSGSRRRTKESIASVRHLYLDIDSDGDARLAALQASCRVPVPNCILTTSAGKYQVLWRVDGFDFEQQEKALKHLVIAFGGDAACTDCNRVVRVPGFRNCKYDPAPVVTVRYLADSVSSPGDFRLEIEASDAPPFPCSRTLGDQASKHSHSERDWVWVLHELAQGKDAVNLTKMLAAWRADKPNPLYYAQRTVDMASARLWLLEGASIDDVMTRLEARRRIELPSVLCTARARQIAATAQRMTVRRPKASCN